MYTTIFLMYLLCNASQISAINKTSKLSKFTKNHSPIYPLPKKHVITDYSDKHKLRIQKFTLHHVPELTTLDSFSDEDIKKGYHEDIESAFLSKQTTSKIYCIEDKPVGFINYRIFQPWYAYGIFKDINHATIHHLLIDDECQKKGFAATLMNYAINDCKTNNVCKVKLRITLAALKNDPTDFYMKWGFKLGASASIAAGGTQELVLTLGNGPVTTVINQLKFF